MKFRKYIELKDNKYINLSEVVRYNMLFLEKNFDFKLFQIRSEENMKHYDRSICNKLDCVPLKIPMLKSQT